MLLKVVHSFWGRHTLALSPWVPKDLVPALSSESCMRSLTASVKVKLDFSSSHHFKICHVKDFPGWVTVGRDKGQVQILSTKLKISGSTDYFDQHFSMVPIYCAFSTSYGVGSFVTALRQM